MSVWSGPKEDRRGSGDSQDFDLYGSGIDWKGVDWRRSVAIATSVSLVLGALGFFGYRWLATSTAVSRGKALQIFQQESKGTSEAARDEKRRSRAKGAGKTAEQKGRAKAADKNLGPGGGVESSNATTTTAPAGSGTAQSQSTEGRTSRARGPQRRQTPAEGVYSWHTSGWEEASGIRRQFPEESQRIITASEGGRWKQHHYFSEEREIWSEFVVSRKGAYLAMQRDRVTFGPVTNDSTIDFAPPMLGTLASPEVGRTWGGSWEGRTSGTYSSRIIDHGEMRIGDEMVEFWKYEIRMQLNGELSGTVLASVMFAPRHALTVWEHYREEIQTDRGSYRAEWTMTLKSIRPHR